MSTDMIETDEHEPAQPLARSEPQRTDAAQSRIESVARVIDAAYQRASSLELTDDERKRLLAAPDDSEIQPGAKGKQNLLYLEHASVRGRMFEVFGPGKWSLICRRMWTENYKTSTAKDAVRVYADCVLIVRGCYVGETIGAGSYFSNNPDQDYSDAAEAAQSEALRRICGKYLGIGLQLWNKAWTEAWKQRRSGNAPQNVHEEAPAPARPPQRPAPRQPEPAPLPPVADAATITERTAWLDGEPTIDEINSWLPSLSRSSTVYDAATRAALFELVNGRLGSAGYTLSTASGSPKFVPPSNTTSEEQIAF